MAGIGFTTAPDKTVPNKSSQDTAWMDWYDSLKSNFGRKKANELFLSAWKVRSDKAANTSNLRSHLEDKGGLKVSGDFLDSVVDLGGGFGDYFGDIFVAGKWISIGLAAVTAAGIGLLIFNIAKAPGETIGTALKYAK